ncbi:T9SS type A sorting domain-containing protein [Candidatus Poribacteria bacterium]|nr:T9SS type A sorting domain-containing protein [Candidatus Poribacteria bacterium]
MKKKQTTNEVKSLFKTAMAASLTIVLVFAVQGIVLAFAGGPPDGYTGAPGESTCVDCHSSFPVNSGPGILSLSGVPSVYTPGSEYQITVNLSQTGQKRWGFELTVLDAGNNKAGTITVTDSTHTQKSAPGREYIKHKSVGTYAGTPDASPGWTFNWTAPGTDIGPVRFYAAGNAANNNSATSGDFIYTIADESLAVELASLTAISVSDSVAIKWSTATETNNLGFNIYRSEKKDGKYIRLNARLIGGAGTDATPHDYSFNDDDVVLGKTYYYYVEDVDFAGNANKSDIIQVTVGQQPEPVIPDRFAQTKPVIPNMFALLQNYPNPFNPDTWVPYKLAKDANVVIRIYNTNGKIIRTLRLENQPAGVYVDKERAAYWDGKNERGDKVASGLYFYTLQAGKFTATKRMVIVK